MNRIMFFKKSLTKKKKISSQKPSSLLEVEDGGLPFQSSQEPKKPFKPGFFGHLSPHEKELFVKRLSYLLKAGIPILQSLEMLKEQTRSVFNKKIIESLIGDISNGQSLHASMQKFKKVFGHFIINVIRIGENTGLLHQNLNYLAEELKKRRILKRKIVGTLVYPGFIAVTTLGMATFLIVFIFPKILPILSSLDVPLPITTRILIALSSFLQHYWFYTLLGIIIFIVAAIFISRIKKVSIFISTVTPSLPVIGQLIQYYNLANICRTLGILLKSSITLTESIKITAETTSDIAYKKILEEIEEDILKGKKISTKFKNYPRFFPVLIPQMLAIGETTGNLAGSFLYLADFYETDLDEMTKTLANVLEPILMILMGAIVGTVVISIITPIYGITQHLNVR